MPSSHEAFENDACAVQDDLLGLMYRADENGLPRLIESVTPDVRAMLALFCYRRSHLHTLALAIATSCDERDLVRFGGRVGSALFALSRNAASPRSAATGGRKTVTLSTQPLSTFAPLDDIEDDDPADSDGEADAGAVADTRAEPVMA